MWFWSKIKISQELTLKFCLTTSNFNLLLHPWTRPVGMYQSPIYHFHTLDQRNSSGSISHIGMRPICQHNFGNNRMLKELRIMLEYYDKFWNNRINLSNMALFVTWFSKTDQVVIFGISRNTNFKYWSHCSFDCSHARYTVWLEWNSLLAGILYCWILSNFFSKPL